jgi:hypothetical protein
MVLNSTTMIETDSVDKERIENAMLVACHVQAGKD